jgi:hypothetical protein
VKPDSRRAAIQIGELNVRLPGGNGEIARRVAEGVGSNLAARVPAGLRRRLGALNLRVEVPAGATEAEMSAAIALEILRGLCGRD